MYKFNGFTEKANRALNLAIEKAETMGHTYIGSEHLLLGILAEGTGAAATLLASEGITEEKVAELLAEKVGEGLPTSLSPDDFTPRSKRILEMSIAAARSISGGYVGTEHILLAIIEEGQSYAVAFLKELGVNPEELSSKILSASEGFSGAGKSASAGKSRTGNAPPLTNSAEISPPRQRPAKSTPSSAEVRKFSVLYKFSPAAPKTTPALSASRRR